MAPEQETGGQMPRVNRETDGCQGDHGSSREGTAARVVGGRVPDRLRSGMAVGVVACHAVLGVHHFMRPT